MTSSHWRAWRPGIPPGDQLQIFPPLISLPVIWITAIKGGLGTNFIWVILQFLKEGSESLHQVDNSNFAHFDSRGYSIPNYFIVCDVSALEWEFGEAPMTSHQLWVSHPPVLTGSHLLVQSSCGVSGFHVVLFPCALISICTASGFK